MDRLTAEKGTLWTVPALGDGAFCLIFSRPRRNAAGLQDYQVLPLYEARAEPSGHTADNFLLRSEETSLGVDLYAALWNVRPIQAEELGEEIGRVISPTPLEQLWDVYLRLADPAIPAPGGRLGNSRPTANAAAWRVRETSRWQPLSGRVFGSRHSEGGGATFVMGEAWALTQAQMAELTTAMTDSDRLINATDIRAIGQTAAFIWTEVRVAAPPGWTVPQTEMFQLPFCRRQTNIVEAVARMDADERTTVRIADVNDPLPQAQAA